MVFCLICLLSSLSSVLSVFCLICKGHGQEENKFVDSRAIASDALIVLKKGHFLGGLQLYDYNLVEFCMVLFMCTGPYMLD